MISGLTSVVFLTSISIAVMNGKTSAPMPAIPLKHVNVPAVVVKSTPPPTSVLPGSIWLVEQHDSNSVYSNGLQIRADYLTSSKPRSYRTFARDTLQPSEWKQVPAGIVYHTTESLLLPLLEAQNRSLARTREALLTMVRHQHLYNFVIDRFGQVYRIVPEDQVAYHAGHSVWADTTTVYEGLNDSFIGVSFEAQTDTSFEATPAQIRSGRMLTEMLRAAYPITAMNCVTHAQVSVNPVSMQIGYHTDWAAHFPFGELGFSNGYANPVAAVAVFGFQYDRHFLEAIGGQPWDGLVSAETDLDRKAQKLGISSAAYRKVLQQRYRLIRKQTLEPRT